tara:strand:+ start:46 stop:195 length:150 start_codon:yes stop_codon:yes gene_type:complete
VGQNQRFWALEKPSVNPFPVSHTVALAAQVGLLLQRFPNVDMILLIKNI